MGSEEASDLQGQGPANLLPGQRQLPLAGVGSGPDRLEEVAAAPWAMGPRILGGTPWYQLGCSTFVEDCLLGQYSEPVARLLVAGKRESTLAQRESAWKAFTAWWVLKDPDRPCNLAEVLDFLTDLVKRGLSAGTVKAYRNALVTPWKLMGVDTSAWELQEVARAAFLANPPRTRRVPEWDLEKVVALLRSAPFNETADDFRTLQKTVFLVALASGNRASELAAISNASVLFTESGVRMAVSPGFLYKNQRVGRCPPDIEFEGLPEDPALCPVAWLRRYRGQESQREGRLFKNTKSGAPLLPGI